MHGNKSNPEGHFQPLKTVNVFKRHSLWSHETDSYHISHIASIGGERIYCFCPDRIRPLVAMVAYSCHWLLMGKDQNWRLVLYHCRYFDKTFTEMFREWSSTKHTFLLQPLNLIGNHGNQKAKFAKTYLKPTSKKPCVRNFYYCCSRTLVTMAT